MVAVVLLSFFTGTVATGTVVDATQGDENGKPFQELVSNIVVSWDDILDIPNDIQDGDDNTTYSGEDFALSSQSCPLGDVVTGIDDDGTIICDAFSLNSISCDNQIAVLNHIPEFVVDPQCLGVPPPDDEPPQQDTLSELLGTNQIVIHLEWQAPEDPNIEDEINSDLDLHLLHPNGEWQDSIWDVYYLNPNPDWGESFETWDDPVLINDGQSGEEFIGFTPSEEGIAYSLGIHNFDDNGLGPSDVFLSVYFEGQLVYTQYQQLGTEEFWYAMDFAIPFADNTINQVTLGFP